MWNITGVPTEMNIVYTMTSSVYNVRINSSDLFGFCWQTRRKFREIVTTNNLVQRFLIVSLTEVFGSQTLRHKLHQTAFQKTASHFLILKKQSDSER